MCFYSYLLTLSPRLLKIFVHSAQVTTFFTWDLFCHVLFHSMKSFLTTIDPIALFVINFFVLRYLWFCLNKVWLLAIYPIFMCCKSLFGCFFLCFFLGETTALPIQEKWLLDIYGVFKYLKFIETCLSRWCVNVKKKHLV